MKTDFKTTNNTFPTFLKCHAIKAWK